MLHRATPDQLDARTLYAVLRLRSEVFVVEQACAFNDLDGQDLDPATVHLWVTGDGDALLGYLRVFADGPRRKISRVCTARTARGTGLGRRLMRAALDEIGDGPSVLDAQAHLVDFYASFGYRQCGDEYDDAGVPHIPMSRP